MANGIPDFRIQQQVPIAAIIQALQQRPLIEEQIRASQQQRQIAPLQFALQAAQAGSALASQSVQRSLQRTQLGQLQQRQQDVQGLSGLAMQAQGPTVGTQQGRIPSPGPVSGLAQPQLTPQQFQRQAAPIAARLQPGQLAQQIQAPRIGQEVSQQAGRAGIQLGPQATQAQFTQAARARELELRGRPKPVAPRAIPTALIESERDIQTNLSTVEALQAELSNLPSLGAGGFTRGALSAATGGFTDPAIRQYQDSRPARAVGLYRAFTGDKRVANEDARERALPLVPSVFEPREVQILKGLTLEDMGREALQLNRQAQKKAQDPTVQIRISNEIKQRIAIRGKVINAMAQKARQLPAGRRKRFLSLENVKKLENALLRKARR